MIDTPHRIITAVRMLRDEGIEPILYGSAGASLYVGEFKKVGDIDLLIESRWLKDDWKVFIEMMSRHGFSLFDQKEHEFMDKLGEKLSFAEKDVLVRDKICDPSKDLVKRRVGDLEVTTLSPAAFRQAYLFSSKDGYRHERRTIKDEQVVALFDKYLAAQEQR